MGCKFGYENELNFHFHGPILLQHHQHPPEWTIQCSEQYSDIPNVHTYYDAISIVYLVQLDHNLRAWMFSRPSTLGDRERVWMDRPATIRSPCHTDPTEQVTMSIIHFSIPSHNNSSTLSLTLNSIHCHGYGTLILIISHSPFERTESPEASWDWVAESETSDQP